MLTPVQPYYTTGQLAKVFRVATRTVAKWCDAGALPCHQLPTVRQGAAPSESPGHRRINHADAVAFCKKRQLPLPPEWLPPVAGSVLLIGLTAAVADAVRVALPDAPVHATDCPVSAGYMLHDRATSGVAVHLGVGRAAALALLRVARSLDRPAPAVVVGILGPTDDGAELIDAGFDRVVSETCPAAELAGLLGGQP